MKVTEAQQTWHQHQPVDDGGQVRCPRCARPWPCRPALRTMPVLDRSGFFD